MKQTVEDIRSELGQPYFCALLTLSLVPIFPEYISFLLVLVAVIFAIKDLRKNHRKIRLGLIGKFLLIYCAYQTFTCVVSTHPMQSLLVSLMWWFFLLAYLVVANLLTDKRRTDRFLMCLTASAGIVGLIACIQYRINFFTDSNTGNLWAWLDNIVFKLVPFDIFHLNYALRAYSTFPNPNMLAQYLVMAAPLVTCYNFMEQRHKRTRLFSRICLFLTFAGVMFSFSRGGYVAMILLAAAIVILNIRHRFAEVSLYVISTILFLPEEVVNRLFTIRKGITRNKDIANRVANIPQSRSASARSTSTTGATTITNSDIINNGGAETAIGERWHIWVEAIHRFLERPLFGYGAGTQPTFAIYEEIGIKAPHAHNIVLQILLEGGIIALFIMGLIAFKTIKNGVVMMRNGYNSSFWIGFSLLAFSVCLLTHGMVDYPLMIPRLVCFFCMFLGFAEQTAIIYESKGNSVRAKLKSHFKHSK